MSPILYTAGEPAGIGPDIFLQHANAHPTHVVVIASEALLKERAALLGLNIDIIAVQEDNFANLEPSIARVFVYDIPLNKPVKVGELDANNAGYVIQTLDVAIAFVQQGKASAMVTGPVHKGIINDSGRAFSGHTEYLRDESGTEEVVMMLATEGLRVALVTTHLPLKDVSAAITEDKIKRTTRILAADLNKHFGCENPKILVCGLNPHAGEDGHLGHEEIDTIIPALEALTHEGLNLQGPLPADTLFQPHYIENADAVLAMYHDQGLPTLKYKGFGQAVNITLGLPFIRTSVDHGTALDLAGTGRANIGSLKVALSSAHSMATLRDKHHAQS